jgi:hypothetical protein
MPSSPGGIAQLREASRSEVCEHIGSLDVPRVQSTVPTFSLISLIFGDPVGTNTHSEISGSPVVPESKSVVEE